MSSNRGDIIAVKQRVQHVGRHCHDVSLVVRLDEVARFQSFNLDEIASTPTKQKYVARKEITSECRLHQRGKSIHATAHIGDARCQPHTRVPLGGAIMLASGSAARGATALDRPYPWRAHGHRSVQSRCPPLPVRSRDVARAAVVPLTSVRFYRLSVHQAARRATTPLCRALPRQAGPPAVAGVT